jgi:hypothetical protein
VLAEELKVTWLCKAAPMTLQVFGELRAALPEETMVDGVTYQSGIGSLLILRHACGPTLRSPPGGLQRTSAPAAAHHAALLDVMHYVRSTGSRGITSGLSTVLLEVWYGLTFDFCLNMRRSWTGWLFSFAGSLHGPARSRG